MKDRIPGLHRQRHKRAMTYGEHMQGCVKGKKDIIFVNISWGLGIGIIIDGRHTRENLDFPENSGMSMFSIMKYCATAAKRMPGNGSLRIGTTPHPVERIGSGEKFHTIKTDCRKIRPPLMKSSPQSIKRTCYALR